MEIKLQTQQITPDPIDKDRVISATIWFKKKIDEDDIEINWSNMQDAYARLSNNERLAIDELLKDKAPNSNKSYRNLLKEYLAYRPL